MVYLILGDVKLKKITKNVLIDIIFGIFIVIFFIVGSGHIISKIIIDTNIETIKELATHDKKVLKNSLESHWDSFDFIPILVKKYNLKTEEDIIKLLQTINSLSSESISYLIDSNKITYASTGLINNDLNIYNTISSFEDNFALYYDDKYFSAVEGRREYLIIGKKYNNFYINDKKIDYAYTKFNINTLNNEFKINSFNDKGFSSLIDINGAYIVNVNRSDSISQRDNFYDYLNINSNEIDNIKNKANGNDGYIFFSNINNERYIVYIVGLEETNWYFVSQVPYSAFSSLMIKLVSVSIAFTFFIVIILIIFISNKIKLIKEREEKEKNYSITLSKALDDARTANKAKTVFLNSMSHDIRTPMNAIIGYTDLAISHYEDSKVILNYLKKISDSSDHLLNLINNILDMSRIESGKVTLNEKEENLKNIIDNIINLISNNIERKNIKFKFTYNVKNNNIICDSVRLSQIIINILSNSIKYTNNYGIIKLEVNEYPNYYSLIFEDNGIGISKEFIDKIYEPFTREDNITNTIEGTGLGLAITKNLIELMDGSIKCESKENIGTRFTVTMPFKRCEELDNNNLSFISTNKIFFKGKRILLVEDNLLNQDITRIALEEIGINVVIANNGYEALKIIRDNKEFDLILMDVSMPIMSGYKATKFIRKMNDEYYKKIPIIGMSANAFIDDSKKALRIGMNDYIIKPIKINNLISMIVRYL